MPAAQLLAMLAVGALAVASAQVTQDCKLYVQQLPDALSGDPVLSSIAVDDAFDVSSVRLQGLSVATDRIGPLKITLSALPFGASAAEPVPKTVLLKGPGQGGSVPRINGAAFDDTVMAAFPRSPSPATEAVSGAFYPQQPLASLAEGAGDEAGSGGSRGVWTLRVADLARAEGEEVSLESWTLVLCPAPVAPAATDNTTETSTPAPMATPAAPAVPEPRVAAEPPERVGAAAPPEPAAPTDDGAVVAAAREEAAEDTATTTLLLQVLDRINRVDLPRNSTLLAPLDGGLIDTMQSRDGVLSVGRDRDGILATRDGFVFGENSTVAYVQERIDDLLGGLGSSSSSTDGRLGGAGGGSLFRAGNTTLPQSATVAFLTSLRSLVDELDAGDATATAKASDASSAPLVQALSRSGDAAAALLSSVASLDAGTGYLGAVGSLLSGLQDQAAGRPVAELRDAGGSAAVSLARSVFDFSSSRLQDTVSLIDGQAGLLEAAVKNRLSGYETALQSAGEIITQSIEGFSSAIMNGGEAIRVAAMDATERAASTSDALKDRLSETTTGKLVSTQLKFIADAGTGIANVAETMRDTSKSVLRQLLSVYRTQLSTAADILTVSADTALSKAQFRAESAVDSLTKVVDAAARALASAAEGKGPLVGTGLTSASSGLSFMYEALKGLRGRIVASPDSFDYGVLRAALDGGSGGAGVQAQEQLKAFYESLGLGTRATKVISLLGGIDRFGAAYDAVLGNGSGN